MEEDSFMWRTFRLNAKEKVHICGNIVHFVNRIMHLVWRKLRLRILSVEKKKRRIVGLSFQL